MTDDDATRSQLPPLVARLATLHVDGPGRGGPHVGIVHNDVTREILAAGRQVVPLLVERLPRSGYDEAVYIVFLLRELRAAEARPAVEAVQAELAQRSIGRDLTLRMQIEYYFRDIDGA